MSISLWDLYRLGGLPIFGRPYDEAIPCYEELTGSDETERFIPKSCEHLFAAFISLILKRKEKTHVFWRAIGSTFGVNMK